MGKIEQEVVNYLINELYYDDILELDETDEIQKVIGKYEIVAWWHPSHFGSAWESKPVVAVQISADDKPNGFLGCGDIEDSTEFHREIRKLADKFLEKTGEVSEEVINEARKRVTVLDSDSDIVALCEECLADVGNLGIDVNIPVQWQIYTSTKSFGEHCLKCEYGSYYHVIRINTKHLKDPIDTVKNTIYHEIAHMLQFEDVIRNGDLIVSYAGFRWKNPYVKISSHGPEWKRYADRISRGLNLDPPITRTSATPEGSEMQKGAGKYQLKCDQCGHIYNYYRMCDTIRHAMANHEHCITGTCGACGKNAKFYLVED